MDQTDFNTLSNAFSTMHRLLVTEAIPAEHIDTVQTAQDYLLEVLDLMAAKQDRRWLWLRTPVNGPWEAFS